MSDLTLADIVTQCMDLEKKAIRIYNMLRDQAKEKDLKAFWAIMCAQEGQHVKYWKGLCDAVQEKKIPDIFDHSTNIRNELNDVEKRWTLFLRKKRIFPNRPVLF